MISNLEPSTLAFASALLGGTFTLLGQLFSFALVKRAKKEQDRQELNSILMSFAVEIEALYDRYNLNFAWVLDQPQFSEGLKAHFFAEEDYMTVFQANARELGKIRNDALRKLILRTYISLKSLLDTYKANNMNLRDISQLERDLLTHVHHEGLTQILAVKKTNLKGYAPVIKRIHDDYIANVLNVLRDIKHEIG